MCLWNTSQESPVDRTGYIIAEAQEKMKSWGPYLKVTQSSQTVTTGS